MKSGFTTGSAAAAAAKASAIYKRYSIKPKSVSILLPSRKIMKIDVNFRNAMAFVVKDAGDDPDVTHNIEIFADVEIANSKQKRVDVFGGKGVGVVTKKGLQVEVGRPAINPIPLKMIQENVEYVLGDNEYAKVTIIVPKGEDIAKKTFNERLGIVGGISILGTSGIVEPMSLKALIATIRCEIDVLLASGEDFFYLVPGKIGERHLKRYTDKPSVQVSNYFLEAFNYLKMKGVKSFGLAGHPGKIAKLAQGYYNTHSKYSPQANQFIANLLKLDKRFNTVEEICNTVESDGFDRVALAVKKRIEADFNFEHLKVLLIRMDGVLIGKA